MSAVHPEIATRQEIQRRLDLYPQLIAELKDAAEFIGDACPAHGEYVLRRIEALLAQAERQES